jgi:hypothetical protein
MVGPKSSHYFAHKLLNSVRSQIAQTKFLPTIKAAKRSRVSCIYPQHPSQIPPTGSPSEEVCANFVRRKILPTFPVLLPNSMIANAPQLHAQDLKFLPLVTQRLIPKRQTMATNSLLKRIVQPKAIMAISAAHTKEARFT